MVIVKVISRQKTSKNKKGRIPTCSVLIEVRTLTSVTDGASLSDDANVDKNPEISTPAL